MYNPITRPCQINSILIQAISYFIVSFSMYLVAQISPLEWKKASVCNHYKSDESQHDLDDEIKEFHHHSSNSLNDCDDDEEKEYELMTNREISIITKKNMWPRGELRAK